MGSGTFLVRSKVTKEISTSFLVVDLWDGSSNRSRWRCARNLIAKESFPEFFDCGGLLGGQIFLCFAGNNCV